MPLRIGTDCSGIEAPIQALRQLNIPFKHMFSSEIDSECEKSLQANYKPKHFYSDLTKRDHTTLPDIDLYVCGFPCQPFSHAGKRKGLEDRRENIFFHAIEVITTKQPKHFILENVKGLLTHDQGKTWQLIQKELSKLEEEFNYKIFSRVLNTKNYGIPQNRERLYIIGMLDETSELNLEPLECSSLESFVDHTDNKAKETSNRHEEILRKLPKDSLFIEFAFGVSKNRTFINSNKICPCITANPRIWSVSKHRYANIKELLALQGFSPDFKQVVSNTQMKKQIGNSMSVNVLKIIFKSILV